MNEYGFTFVLRSKDQFVLLFPSDGPGFIMDRPWWDESKMILIFGVGPEDLIFLELMLRNGFRMSKLIILKITRSSKIKSKKSKIWPCLNYEFQARSLADSTVRWPAPCVISNRRPGLATLWTRTYELGWTETVELDLNPLTHPLFNLFPIILCA